ncbi:hypothetical protein [Thermodesulfatator atlanticus]|uniref:hypothetical protein n=1 Tax=Thermodesulfatator atlanticus TaxID=501497 RepID=UPI0003B5FB88|nr:hypothetical protein [Thermodesulfatator atlanticus]
MPKDYLTVEVDLKRFPGADVKLCFKSLKGEIYCTRAFVEAGEKEKKLTLKK